VPPLNPKTPFPTVIASYGIKHGRLLLFSDIDVPEAGK
jgi:hypothetical protein